MLPKNISLVALGIASLITLYLFLAIRSFFSIDTTPGPLQWRHIQPQQDTAFGGLFYHPYLDDSLPYYKYRVLADSIQRIKDVIDRNNKSRGDSKGFAFMSVNALTDEQPAGVRNWQEHNLELRQLSDSMNMLNNKSSHLPQGTVRDSIEKLSGDLLYRYNVRVNQILREEKEKEEKRYYFGLKGYETNHHETTFFLDKGTYNLAYIVWDSVEKRSHDSTKFGHYERKRIPVRYAAEDKKILIPITKQQYRVTAIMLELCTFATIFFFLYIFVGLPAQIIINISKGKAFTLKNIRRFKVMAFVLATSALLALLAPLVIHWIFRDTIPEDFQLEPFASNMLSRLPVFLTALALFVIGKAFERGYQLQQESALTI